MKQLDPKYVWLNFVQVSMNIFLSFLFVTSMFFLAYGRFPQADQATISGFLIWTTGIYILILLFNYFWSVLTYKFYRYEIREDGFRKEHGVIRKKYVTIPYERIQNVDIYRGLLARIFRLSDLNIQTAGMSTGVSSYGGGSEGRLPGLSPEVAEQLRDELVKRARGKHQGI
jgi:membrane protein YdbS with pleckstrin-like domain